MCTTTQDEAGRNLVNTTSEALEAGIAVCGPGKPFKAIGKAIHDVADQGGYSVSSQFTGHGIGEVFHRPPWILHHRESRCLNGSHADRETLRQRGARRHVTRTLLHH